MDWFRWHHGTVADRKWPRIASRAGTTVANVIAVWAALLEAASQAEDRGAVHLSDDDCEDLDAALGMPADTTRAVIAELRARDLIGANNRLTAWEKRQPPRERADNSTERVRKYRERQRAAGDGDAAHETPQSDNETDVTPCNASETKETPRGEERILEEKREDQKKRAAARSAPPPPKPEGVTDETWRGWLELRAKKRAPVTDAVLREAEREAAKAGLSLERFLAVWCYRGSQGLQADWLRPHERAGPPHGSPSKPSAAADFRATTYTGTPDDELPLELR